MAADVGNMINNKKGTKAVPPAEMPTTRNAIEYNMNHKKRGLALMFIHESFENPEQLAKRDGADKDFEGVKEAFGQLGFEVIAYWDSTINQIMERTKEAAARDHTDNDCIAIIISTHGEGGGYLHAHNGAYSVDRIFQMFTADQCPTLAGKPKLFFIQACRGVKMDHGITLKKNICTDALGSQTMSTSYRIPLHADFLIAYSTIPDFVSWHSLSKGSWFIQILVKQIKENANTCDILSLLTFVNQHVAINFESHCPDKPKDDYKKQMPCFISMLTRFLYFPNKS